MRCAAWRPRWKCGTAGGLWYFVFGARAPADGGDAAANREAAAPHYTTPCRGRCLHRPGDVRGTARPRGRGMPLPYKPSEHDPRNRTTATHRASVGRDAPIPPHPAAAQGSPGGINPAPTNKFCVWGQTGTAAAFRAAVGRDALIPPDPEAVHPANSRDAAKRAANRFMQSPSVLIFPGAPPGPTVYGFIIWPGASNVRPAGAPSRLKYG